MTPIQKLIAERGGCPAFAEWSGEPVRNVQRWAAGSHAPRLADGARILRLSDAEMSEETEDENTAIISSTALLACPFCGEQPDVETLGTWVEIMCCASMSFQKCDHLTLEERDTWDDQTHKLSPEVEAKVLKIAIDCWNTRAS